MRRGFTLIELLVVITIIGILVALALPNFIKAKDKAMEAEVKSNLHSIQISLERYATDNDGMYPAYIYGGSLLSWKCSFGYGCTHRMSRQAHHNAQHYYGVPETLINDGYLSIYPRNPFIRIGKSICDLTGSDPRFGCIPDQNSANPLTTAISDSGNVMANILSDPNFTGPGLPENLNFGGDLGTWSPNWTTGGSIPYYFIGDGNPKTKDFIPGSFIYRSLGSSAGDLRQWSNRVTTGQGILPSMYESYVLSAYGSERSVGKDYLHCLDTKIRSGGNGFSMYPGEPGHTCVPKRGFNPGALANFEPHYGSGDVDGDGYSDTIPNVIFAKTDASLTSGSNHSPTNADGQTDGLLIYFASGVDQSVGVD
tara:strand:+ start:83 stop:1183 length:1101 start_codon:yes stop_codon:yes gene_type:complete